MTLIGVKTFPKRAQAEIAKLRQEVEHWRTKALAVDPEKTNVMISGGGMDPDVGLPKDSTITFRVGNERFDVSAGNHGIAVRARDGLLVLRPVVANVVHISDDKR